MSDQHEEISMSHSKLTWPLFAPLHLQDTSGTNILLPSDWVETPDDQRYDFSGKLNSTLGDFPRSIPSADMNEPGIPDSEFQRYFYNEIFMTSSELLLVANFTSNSPLMGKLFSLVETSDEKKFIFDKSPRVVQMEILELLSDIYPNTILKDAAIQDPSMDGGPCLSLQWIQIPCHDMSQSELVFDFKARSNGGNVATTSHDIYFESWILRYFVVLDPSMDGELRLRVQWTMQKPCRDMSPPDLGFVMDFHPRSNGRSVASASHDIYSERILSYMAALDSMDGELSLKVKLMQIPRHDVFPPFNPRSNEETVATRSQNCIAIPFSKETNTRKISDNKCKSMRYSISLETIEALRSMRMEDAVMKLGISKSTLKRKCRELGISNWQRPKEKKDNCSITKQTLAIKSAQGTQDPTVIDPSVSTQVLGVAGNLSLSDSARLNPPPFISVSCNAGEYLKQTARGKPEEISVIISELYTPLPVGDLPGSSVLIEALVSAARNVQATLVDQLLSMDPFHPRAMVQEANPVLKFLENCPINVVAFCEAIKNYIVTSYELALAQGDQSIGFSAVLEEARLHVESLTLKQSNLNDCVLESKSGLEHTRLEIEHYETQLADLRSRHQKERLALGEIERNLDCTTQELFDAKRSLDDLSDHLKMLEKAVDNSRNELRFSECGKEHPQCTTSLISRIATSSHLPHSEEHPFLSLPNPLSSHLPPLKIKVSSYKMKYASSLQHSLLFSSTEESSPSHIKTRGTDETNPSRFFCSPWEGGVMYKKAKAENNVTKEIEAEAKKYIFNNIWRINQLEKIKIKDYIFDEEKDPREVLVEIYIQHVNRSSMLTLKPGKWIDADIINTIVNKLTLEQVKLYPNMEMQAWYLPTYFSQIILAGNFKPQHLANSYFGAGRYTGKLSACEKVYIPFNTGNNHWLLCMINFRCKCINILDPLSTKALNQQQEEEVRTLANSLQLILKCHHVSDNIPKIDDFPIERLDWVPQQNNSHDCGLYLIKYLEERNLVSGMQYKFDSAEEREKLAMDLFLHEDNTKKHSVLRNVL
ncbi:hypothetical protein F0562_030728 [Nyssa sinensis]|uniref:Ubiquitin-like protease family profile domain-containing protein n=1 Tax=Nyssa sinensis TaxID=561372 RepID=A0A5J5AZQ1_9ASTE|nr:hypothetical protein F0562_030728 [Nyssa sinensis]